MSVAPGRSAATPSGHTHAGAVVWYRSGDEKLFLLVTARGAADEWVLPKGHIEPGESPERTAEREVREEAGLDVRVDTYLGTEAFTMKTTDAVCAYYLARLTRGGDGDESEPPSSGPALEGRQMVWLPIADALERASFPAGRNMLEAARAMLRGDTGGSDS